MELNGDGIPDILSGSYSRMGQDMAGLFQVLHGKPGGGYGKATVLNGSDGKPLILTPGGSGANGGSDPVIDKICTRPFAADLDGDGVLDLIVGNFAGTFAMFRGEGHGRFAPTNTWLRSGNTGMCVKHHGDPCLCDWDGDGDLDLLSGSAAGGVVWFENTGDTKHPRFAEQATLVPAPDLSATESRLGDAHLTGPQGNTRVTVADVDGDGKLDLLIGDSMTLHLPVDGVDETEARQALRRYQEGMDAIATAPDATTNTPEVMQARGQRIAALDKERDRFVREQSTGFVWWLRRK